MERQAFGQIYHCRIINVSAGDRSLITSFENLKRVLGIVKRHIGFQRVPARVICDLKGSCHLSKLKLIFLHIHIKKRHFFSSSLMIIHHFCARGCAHLFSFRPHHPVIAAYPTYLSLSRCNPSSIQFFQK